MAEWLAWLTTERATHDQFPVPVKFFLGTPGGSGLGGIEPWIFGD
jgi:hypothetical protein